MGVQITMFDKILQYDRAFHDRVGEEVVIGIVFQERFRASLRAKQTLRDAVTNDDVTTVNGVPVRFVDVELADDGLFEDTLSQDEFDLLYVMPLRARALEELLVVSRAHHIATLTAVPEYVARGIGIGLGVRGGKPEIIVNQAACEAEGVDLSSQLLRLAHVL